VKWAVDLHNDFVPEYRVLHKDVQDELLAQVGLLEQIGPLLGRPRVEYPQRLTSREHEGIEI
jgi:hypothetical protein